MTDTKWLSQMDADIFIGRNTPFPKIRIEFAEDSLSPKARRVIDQLLITGCSVLAFTGDTIILLVPRADRDNIDLFIEDILDLMNAHQVNYHSVEKVED